MSRRFHSCIAALLVLMAFVAGVRAQWNGLFPQIASGKLERNRGDQAQPDLPPESALG
jgi:hypothetical protein